jgi:ABC-type Co2+ transport system permease subunit
MLNTPKLLLLQLHVWSVPTNSRLDHCTVAAAVTVAVLLTMPSSLHPWAGGQIPLPWHHLDTSCSTQTDLVVQDRQHTQGGAGLAGRLVDEA